MNTVPGFYTCPNCGLPQAPANFCADLRCRTNLVAFQQHTMQLMMPQNFQQMVQNAPPAGCQPSSPFPLAGSQQWGGAGVQPPMPQPPAMGWAPPVWYGQNQMQQVAPAILALQPQPFLQHFPQPVLVAQPLGNVQQPYLQYNFLHPAMQAAAAVQIAPTVQAAPVPPMHQPTGFVEEARPSDLETRPGLSPEPSEDGDGLSEEEVEEEEEEEDLDVGSQPRRALRRRMRPREGVVYVDSDDEEFSSVRKVRHLYRYNSVQHSRYSSYIGTVQHGTEVTAPCCTVPI
jgi:hypothetical protein